MPEVRYRPYGAAARLHEEVLPSVIISGPARAGKTLACLWRVFRMAMKYPGSRHLLARKSRASMAESVLATLEDEILAPCGLLGKRLERTYRRTYQLPNGSELVVGGLDDVSKIMGAQYDSIYISEATEATENDWESLSTRLSHGKMPYHQILGCCNPQSPQHWIYQRWQQGRLTLLSQGLDDNPYLPQSTREVLQSLTGVRYQRLYLGNWVAAEGAIYPEWGEANLVETVPNLSGWTKVVGIDFGYQNPMAVQWWAISPDGDWLCYRQLYQSGLLVSELAKVLKKYAAEDGHISAYYADHDAEDRATLRAEGIYTQAANKAVVPGIQSVQELIAAKRLKVYRGALIARDSGLVERRLPTCLEEEIPEYQWQQSPEGRPVKEQPVKMNDHACDAMRMAVYSYIVKGKHKTEFFTAR